MATLLRAVRTASVVSRAAAIAMASRSARPGTGVAAASSLVSGVLCLLKSCPARRDVSTTTKPPLPFPSTAADYAQLPDDAKTPTGKDMESDEGVWALYERWCKAFRKQRDHAEMVRRFKVFKYYAQYVHEHNTYVPHDPEEAAIRLQKRREVQLLLDRGEDVSHLDELAVPYALGRLNDGGDPDLRQCDYDLLKQIEEMEARGIKNPFACLSSPVNQPAKAN